VAEILGYGPIEPLLARDDVTEVMVNGPSSVYIETQGRLELTDIKFESEEHVARIIDRIVSPLGRRIDESQPYVDARLPDGSRVNAVIPPLSLVGPILTIRKFSRIPITAQTLVELNGSSPLRRWSSARPASGQAEHGHLGRNRLGQDDDAQRLVGSLSPTTSGS
jgi:pilus assembly protein CpaF